MASIPRAEVTVSRGQVRDLLADQCPELADLPLTGFGHGWDNVMFALGDDLLVRLPRRAVAAPLIDHEVRCLPRVRLLVDVAVPVPIFAGRPGRDFPWPWTVVPRLPGSPACDVPVSGRSPAAEPFAAFMTGLHRPAPPDAPANPFRAVALASRAERWRSHILAAVGESGWDQWQEWADAPAWPGPPVWVHGDPHPLNVLLDADGRLSGVVDWGDVTAGDPASDLAMAWLMFDVADRARFRAVCDASGRYDDAIWRRARAWALGLASVFVEHSDDLPTLAAVGRHGLAQLSEAG